MRPHRSIVSALLLTAVTALTHTDGRAQESGAFVTRLGNDTLAVEKVTRTDKQIRGEYVIRSPRTSHRTYTADLAADGTIRRLEMVSRNLGAGPGPKETKFTIEFTGDSAISTAPRGDSTVTARVAAMKGAIPSLQAVMAIFEQLGRQARAAKASSYTTTLVGPGSTTTNKMEVVPGNGDTLKFFLETSVGKFGPWNVRLDKSGRLLSYSGTGTPFQAEAVRVANWDIAAAAASYADRPLGQLSARDSVRAMLGTDSLWVEYSRPAKRGREIFGSVVPWNTVWRTGANAATHFRTSKDVVIGGTAVPAGTYTLWTLPTPKGWKLMINKQTGQWGTAYDQKQDLARVDLQVETLMEPVELFTIEIEPQGDKATLRMSWDRTRVAVPIEGGKK